MNSHSITASAVEKLSDRENIDFSLLLKSFLDEPIWIESSTAVTAAAATASEDSISDVSYTNSESTSPSLFVDQSMKAETYYSSLDVPPKLSSHASSNVNSPMTSDAGLIRSAINGKSASASSSPKNGKSEAALGTTGSSHRRGRKTKNDDEEKERLKRENQQLRDEIEDLRGQLHSLPAGKDSYSIENELLKKCLNEHKKFIQNCLNISMPSEKLALRSIGKQGADFTFNHILNIIASSQISKDWQLAKCNNYQFNTLKYGENIMICYRKRKDDKGRVLTDLRMDFISPKMDPEDTTNIMWDISSSTEIMLQVIGQVNPFDFSCTFKENKEVNDSEEGDEYEGTEFHIYREYHPEPEGTFDCAMISGKTTKDLAVSTLLPRPEFTPLAEIIREQYTPKILSQNVFNRRYSRKAPTSATARTLKVGDVRCHMIARSATQYTACTQTGMADPLPHWIKSYAMVAALSWQHEAQVEISVPVVNESGQQKFQFIKQTVPATHTIFVCSIFDESFRVQTFKNATYTVTDDGEVSPVLGASTELFCSVVVAKWREMRKKRMEEANQQEEEVTDASASKKQKDEVE